MVRDREDEELVGALADLSAADLDKNQFALEHLSHAMWLDDPQTERRLHYWLEQAYRQGLAVGQRKTEER